MIKYYREYLSSQPPAIARKVTIEEKQWVVKERTSTTNLRQLLVIDEMIKQQKLPKPEL